MKNTFVVRCPDCGSSAIRSYIFAANSQVKTECPRCDYLIIVDLANGKVKEASTSCTAIAPKPSSDRHIHRQQTQILPFSIELSA